MSGARERRAGNSRAHTGEQPFAWNAEAARTGARARVFCASMADVFEDRRDLDRAPCEAVASYRRNPASRLAASDQATAERQTPRALGAPSARECLARSHG